MQIQNGDWAEAIDVARKAISEVPWLRFNELTAPVFPLYVEACLGPDWFEGAGGLKSLGRLSRAAFMARFCGWRFPNIRPHSLRISGRLAAARCHYKKSEKYFADAIRKAEAIGAKYEQARSFIDRSVLDYPEAKSDRDRGLVDRLEPDAAVSRDARGIALDDLEQPRVDAGHRADCGDAGGVDYGVEWGAGVVLFPGPLGDA